MADGDGLFAQVAASGSVLWRWLGHIFADDGYAGPKLRGGLDRIGEWTIEIVKRTDANAGFKVLPKRRVAERTFARLGRCRRLAKDGEKSFAFIRSVDQHRSHP